MGVITGDEEKKLIKGEAVKNSGDVGELSPLPALERCPFCGGSASFGIVRISSPSPITNADGTEKTEGHFVNCVFCQANNNGLTHGYQTQGAAAERWNRRAASDWQPIETAPVNQSVLVYIPNAEHYGEGIYRAILIESDWTLVDGKHPRHWQTTGWHVGRDLPDYATPTRWMPLPDPPETGCQRTHGT